ncbi:molybdate ABC transporter substrate-binding protein [Martelella soudanensis]|uniref:molybdate ABC transporter substrate-binding protein n=1 Tax=unclassified Martelella TaxID=2629616 RepID=UPI0015DD6046|nr:MULTISPECIES: molybdate ABC transporter substrate-binding protein [unclassified Martelella]
MRRILLLALLLLPVTVTSAAAGEVTIAVAANFTGTAEEIAEAFREETGHDAVLSFGSTGRLYAQIIHGAPYDVFLAADLERPDRAIAEGYAVEGSAFVYALGALVLYSTDPELVDADGAVLFHPERFGKLAIANPRTAPYGAAAVEAMRSLGVYDRLSDRLVEGENITQAFQFVATGNAGLGFVALSQVIDRPGGSRYEVPADLYRPIAQGAVLLKNGENNSAARAFMSFLKGEVARKIVENHGYRLPP